MMKVRNHVRVGTAATSVVPAALLPHGQRSTAKVRRIVRLALAVVLALACLGDGGLHATNVAADACSIVQQGASNTANRSCTTAVGGHSNRTVPASSVLTRSVMPVALQHHTTEVAGCASSACVYMPMVMLPPPINIADYIKIATESVGRPCRACPERVSGTIEALTDSPVDNIVIEETIAYDSGEVETHITSPILDAALKGDQTFFAFGSLPDPNVEGYSAGARIRSAQVRPPGTYQRVTVVSQHNDVLGDSVTVTGQIRNDQAVTLSSVQLLADDGSSTDLANISSSTLAPGATATYSVTLTCDCAGFEIGIPTMRGQGLATP